jgi:hypothetical protein
MVREAVLAESDAASTHVYLPHAGTVSLVVNLSEGQTVEVAVTVFRRLTRSCCFPAPPRSSTSPTSG